MNASPLDNKDNNGSKPSDDEMRDALARVVASNAFASAPRLQQFLSYVVEETLAGRGGAIVGKAIAVEVYGRKLLGDSGQNLVRVEARRLRRTLDEYYSGAGAGDPWRIQIDLGGYGPRFVSAASSVPSGDKASSFTARSPVATRTILLVSLILIVVFAIGLALNRGADEPGTSPGNGEASRAAYRERSIQALQAVNLAEQARGMFFPVFDLKRQEISLEMYRHAISLDPGLHQGYAGAAQVLATLSLFATDAAKSAAFLDEAGQMAEKAMELSPENAWAHGANALVVVVSGDLEGAMAEARLAVRLAPEDGHVLDLAGVTSILANEPDFAAETSSPDRPHSGAGRFGANNIWGLSQLMLGHYDEVIKAFSTAPESGVPVSAPSLVFLAVAYDHLGSSDNARASVQELSEKMAEFPVGFIVSRVFQNEPAYGQDIMARLTKYGFQVNPQIQ